jgi:DNA-binding transcriptional MerR regulator
MEMDEAAKPLEKAYYSIGEVAALLNVNASLIRFWETKFDELEPKKTRKGNRQFTPKEVEILKTIYFLVKEKGYTLKGAQEKLKADKHKLENETRLAQTLQQVRAFLVELKELL